MPASADISEVATIARMWRVSRVDGMIIGFTDHDQDINHEDITYFARGAMRPSEIESKLGLAFDGAEISGAIAHDLVAREDLNDGLYNGALVEHFLFDWQAGRIICEEFSAEIAAITFNEFGFAAELRAPFSELGQVFGRGFHKSCDARLGDERCGVRLSDQNPAITASIEGVKGNVILISNAHNSQIDLSGAIIISGGRDKESASAAIRRVHQREGKIALELWSRPPAQFMAGANIAIIQGCDKSLECCRDRFGNVANFRGFPHIPGEGWIANLDAN